MFNSQSYDLHKRHIDKQSNEKVRLWRRDDTTDFFIHNEVYNLLNPLTESHPGAYWLTVGDGRGGTDAHALKARGAKAHASDLALTHLSSAMAEGYIDECSAQNAENLSFDDCTFDFVLCKESYHHFPRPMVAIYELLRVAKLAVVVIEPCDSEIFTPDELTWRSGLYWLWQGIKNSVKKAVGMPIYYEYGFHEEVGNYLYSVSKREFTKLAMGMDLPAIAFKGINMIYLPGMENEVWHARAPLYREMLRRKSKMDRRSRTRIRPFNLLSSVIFKSNPSSVLVKALQRHDYTYRTLPRNPYRDQ